ncbi:MAG: type II toxin-antitoxin system RelE/ParE family toxin [Candidatus Paceibacterota bacterium]
MNVIILDDSLENFIKSLDKITLAKVIHKIELLEKFGNRLEMPHSKKINKDLFELRISGNLEIRIFFTFYKNKAILLNGFRKKSNKLPKNEINKAINYINNLD